MNAWANSQQKNAVSRVESLLGNMKVSPDAMTYSTLLKTVAASALSDKGDRAEKIVKLMKQGGFEPNGRDLKQLELATGRGNKREHDERIVTTH